MRLVSMVLGIVCIQGAAGPVQSKLESAKTEERRDDRLAKLVWVNSEIDRSLSCKDRWHDAKRFIKNSVNLFSIPPDKIKYKDMSPLLAAVECDGHEDYEFAHFLLEHGADADSRNHFENIFFRVKSVSMAKLLHAHRVKQGYGPISMLRSQTGGNLLHDALWKVKDPALLAYYSAHDVDPNGLDKRGYTPLMILAAYASQYSCSAEIKKRLSMLIDAGAIIEHGAPAIVRWQEKNVVSLLRWWQEGFAQKFIVFAQKHYLLYTQMLCDLRRLQEQRKKYIAAQLAHHVRSSQDQKQEKIIALIGDYYEPSWDMLTQDVQHEEEKYEKEKG